MFRVDRKKSKDIFAGKKFVYLCSPKIRNADVVKLVDTLDLGSSAVRCVGSSPSIRTK